ncbi:MAG: hypothetical protein EAZ97_16360 [Bacteroidetes bacterium]|nr:MAG: hypothetical protein EAZ97_16360 [Bacteroidota bacterium]
MIFNIQNLGVVKGAEIDLSKDLILLCGDNNTGKTYVAYAIYYFLKENFNDYFSDAITIVNNIYRNHESMLIAWEKINQLTNQLKNEKKITVDFVELIREIVLPFKEKIFKEVINLFVNEYKLSDFFNSKYLSDIVLSINLTDEKILNNILKYQLEAIMLGEILLFKVQDSSIALFSLGNRAKYIDNIEILANYIFTFLFRKSLFKASFLSNHNNSTYIFTAERSAINIFSKELALSKNKLFDKILKSNKKDLFELAQKSVNRYPKPIQDSLEIAEDLQMLSKQKSEFEYLAVELEQSILGGKVALGEYGDLRYKPDSSPEIPALEIHLTSSLVKSLSPMAFYLRHLAQKNDCMIIDEPELNLHPKNQILLARFLARLVNEGFKVIASTHSDYIIKELSNLILLKNNFSEKEDLLKKYEYQENQLLPAEKVGVYVFKDGYSKQVPISEQGIEIDSIELVINDLNQRSNDIYYSYIDSIQP